MSSGRIHRLAAPLALAALLWGGDALAQGRRGVALPSGTGPAKEVADRPMYGASHALVIGIDAYHAGWPRLGNAIKDAELVAAALKDQGFQVSLHKDLDAQALKETFERFFVVAGADEDARLFVWFAGHGHTEDGLGFLVPADAPRPGPGPEFRLKALSLRRFGEFVRLARAKHALAVFDSCFAGTIFAAQRSMPPAAITRATGLPVRQFVSSGDADQEVSDDGRFRKLFLRALRGESAADANDDGYLTGSELGLFLTDRVTNLTEARQTPRYGKLNDEDFDRGDFVFALAGALGVSKGAPPPTPPAGGAAPSRAAPTPAAPAAPADADFARLLSEFKELAFNSKRVAFLERHAQRRTFTCEQVARLLKRVPHKDARRRCLEALAGRVSDPENIERILGVLTFRSEKEDARRILGSP